MWRLGRALFTTVAVLAAAARLSDVSLGGSGGGRKPAPIRATGSVSPGAPRSVFLGSPFATPFRVSMPGWRRCGEGEAMRPVHGLSRRGKRSWLLEALRDGEARAQGLDWRRTMANVTDRRND